MPFENPVKQFLDLFNASAEMLVITFERPLQVVHDLQDINCKTLVCMLYPVLVITGSPLPVIIKIRCKPEIPII